MFKYDKNWSIDITVKAVRLRFECPQLCEQTFVHMFSFIELPNVIQHYNFCYRNIPAWLHGYFATRIYGSETSNIVNTCLSGMYEDEVICPQQRYIWHTMEGLITSYATRYPSDLSLLWWKRWYADRWMYLDSLQKHKFVRVISLFLNIYLPPFCHNVHKYVHLVVSDSRSVYRRKNCIKTPIACWSRSVKYIQNPQIS